MGAGEGAAIAAQLVEAGKPASTPMAMVESASLADMDVTYGTLQELASWSGKGGPALILLGEVYGEAAAVALRGLRKATRSA
jgi:uroporphyrin-III C-methyltransferase